MKGGRCLHTAGLIAVAAGFWVLPLAAPLAAGNLFTGWVCPEIQGQVVACELEITSLVAPVGNAPVWLPYPLADFAGMTEAQVTFADSVPVLRVLLNIRQEDALPMAVPGGIALSQQVQARVGPTLTVALQKWFRSDGTTQALAGGPTPPVPGYATPPGPGQACWWDEDGLSPPACDASPATVGPTGLISDPGLAKHTTVVREGLSDLDQLVHGGSTGTQSDNPSAEGGVCRGVSGVVPCVENAREPVSARRRLPPRTVIVGGVLVLCCGFVAVRRSFRARFRGMS